MPSNLEHGKGRIMELVGELMNGCIYPGPHNEMSEEHYLPEALGRFQGYEPLLRRVCRSCNTRIGNAVETQFLRAGPIAFFRWMLGIQGRNGLAPSPFYRGAGGAPPLYMYGRVPEFPYDLLWEVDPGTRGVYPLRQIVFEHPLADARPVPVLDRMLGRPDALIDHLRERGLERARPVHAFAAPHEIPQITDLLRAVGGVPPGEWATTNWMPQQVRLVVELRVTEAYFRAVAKIAFHYILKMFPDLTGMETQFDPIKGFIWAGGEINRFVRECGDQFFVNFRRGYRPTHWMHILAVERSYDVIIGYAQFFAGPQFLPRPYEVRIGRDPARIVKRVDRRAHHFVILDPTCGGGPVGVMEDLQPAQFIWTP